MIRSPQNVVLLIRFDAISNDHLFCVWAKPIPSENGGQQNPQGSSACRTKKIAAGTFTLIYLILLMG
jgi:hypothetical protein